MNLSATLTLSIVSLLVSGPVSAAAEKVYKWKDAKGGTHYSQQPPFNTQTEVIKPPTGHSDPIEYKNTVATVENKQATTEGKTMSYIDKERCDNAKKVAETLKNHVRIKVKGDDGQYRFLTSDEHLQKTNDANLAIKESCE